MDISVNYRKANRKANNALTKQANSSLKANQLSNNHKSREYAMKINQKILILWMSGFLILNFALFQLPGVPGSIPNITREMPNALIPDMQLLISPDAISLFLSQIGVQGRWSYQVMHLSIDLAFPILYSLLLFMFGRILKQKTGVPINIIGYTSLAAGIADLCENFTYVYLTHRYPDQLQSLSYAASTFTLIKFSAITASLIGLAILTIHYVRLKKAS